MVMKRLVPFAVALLLTNLANAQFLKVGPKGGANMVKIEGTAFKDAFELGYYAGAFVEIKLAKNLYLMPEVLWSENQLSTSSDFNDIYRNLLSVEELTSMKLQSLSIPVSLNWKVANILALSGGAQFSRNIQSGETFLKSAEAAITDGNISAMAGANLHLGKFRVHARYLWGLKDVNNLSENDPWKQQSAQVGIGFVF